MTHLLLDERTFHWLGEFTDDHGIIGPIKVISQEREALKPLLRAAKQVEKQRGISVLSSLTSVGRGQKTVQWVKEIIPLASPEAMKAFTLALPKFGVIVFTIEPAQAPYWERIKRWPISDAVRFRLLFMMRQIPEDKLSLLDEEWKSLFLQMETESL
ncbi:hypothetical protein KBB27_03420 [Patescibacteria group bacterium]|nr:hypothetical protein [Patescibacteria group bacterium]